MTGYVLIALWLLAVCSWPVIGRQVALRRVPRYLEERWQDHARSCPTLTTGEHAEHYRHQHRQYAAAMVRAWTWRWRVLWPMALWDDRTMRAIESRDPYIQQQIVAEQKRRIAELEKELGYR